MALVDVIQSHLKKTYHYYKKYKVDYEYDYLKLIYWHMRHKKKIQRIAI